MVHVMKLLDGSEGAVPAQPLLGPSAASGGGGPPGGVTGSAFLSSAMLTSSVRSKAAHTPFGLSLVSPGFQLSGGGAGKGFGSSSAAAATNGAGVTGSAAFGSAALYSPSVATAAGGAVIADAHGGNGGINRWSSFQVATAGAGRSSGILGFGGPGGGGGGGRRGQYLAPAALVILRHMSSRDQAHLARQSNKMPLVPATPSIPMGASEPNIGDSTQSPAIAVATEVPDSSQHYAFSTVPPVPQPGTIAAACTAYASGHITSGAAYAAAIGFATAAGNGVGVLSPASPDAEWDACRLSMVTAADSLLAAVGGRYLWQHVLAMIDIVLPLLAETCEFEAAEHTPAPSFTIPLLDSSLLLLQQRALSLIHHALPLSPCLSDAWDVLQLAVDSYADHFVDYLPLHPAFSALSTSTSTQRLNGENGLRKSASSHSSHSGASYAGTPPVLAGRGGSASSGKRIYSGRRMSLASSLAEQLSSVQLARLVSGQSVSPAVPQAEGIAAPVEGHRRAAETGGSEQQPLQQSFARASQLSSSFSQSLRGARNQTVAVRRRLLQVSLAAAERVRSVITSQSAGSDAPEGRSDDCLGPSPLTQLPRIDSDLTAKLELPLLDGELQPSLAHKGMELLHHLLAVGCHMGRKADGPIALQTWLATLTQPGQPGAGDGVSISSIGGLMPRISSANLLASSPAHVTLVTPVLERSKPAAAEGLSHSPQLQPLPLSVDGPAAENWSLSTDVIRALVSVVYHTLNSAWSDATLCALSLRLLRDLLRRNSIEATWVLVPLALHWSKGAQRNAGQHVSFAELAAAVLTSVGAALHSHELQKIVLSALTSARQEAITFSATDAASALRCDDDGWLLPPPLADAMGGVAPAAASPSVAALRIDSTSIAAAVMTSAPVRAALARFAGLEAKQLTEEAMKLFASQAACNAFVSPSVVFESLKRSSAPSKRLQPIGTTALPSEEAMSALGDAVSALYASLLAPFKLDPYAAGLRSLLGVSAAIHPVSAPSIAQPTSSTDGVAQAVDAPTSATPIASRQRKSIDGAEPSLQKYDAHLLLGLTANSTAPSSQDHRAQAPLSRPAAVFATVDGSSRLRLQAITSAMDPLQLLALIEASS